MPDVGEDLAQGGGLDFGETEAQSVTFSWILTGRAALGGAGAPSSAESHGPARKAGASPASTASAGGRASTAPPVRAWAPAP